MKNRVAVAIAGQEYTLVGSEDAAYTKKVAAHVDAKIQEVQEVQEVPDARQAGDGRNRRAQRGISRRVRPHGTRRQPQRRGVGAWPPRRPSCIS